MVRIDIEPLGKYTSRGELYRTSVAGRIILHHTHLPVVATCRSLLAEGVTGPFEAWRVSGTYADMRGDISRAAGITVREDKKITARWAWYTPYGGKDGLQRADDRGADPEGAGSGDAG